MGTTIRPEISKKNRYWIDNHYSSFADNDKKNKGVAITMDGKIVADFIAGNMIQGVGLQTAPDPNGDIWFEVTQDGTLTARKGVIGGCEIQNGVLQIKNANIEEVLTGHTLKGSIIEGSQFISTPVEVTNDDGNKETKSLFEVTKEGQVYIRAEAIINKLSSATNAANSAFAASTSETNAANSASSAAGSASAASTSESNAAASADNAEESANMAKMYAQQAKDTDISNLINQLAGYKITTKMEDSDGNYVTDANGDYIETVVLLANPDDLLSILERVVALEKAVYEK